MKHLILVSLVLLAGCSPDHSDVATTSPQTPATHQAVAMQQCTALQQLLDSHSGSLQSRQPTQHNQLRDAAEAACIEAYLTAPLDTNPRCADIQRNIAKYRYMGERAPSYPAFREIVRRRQADLEACQTSA